MQAVAIQFTKEPKSQDALHGRSAMLRCEVSDPTDITYRWLHNGQRLENSERRLQEGGNLKFTAVDRQLDAGSFKCVAENPVTGEIRYSTNASFNIKCECWISSLSPPPHPLLKAAQLSENCQLTGFLNGSEGVRPVSRIQKEKKQQKSPSKMTGSVSQRNVSTLLLYTPPTPPTPKLSLKETGSVHQQACVFFVYSSV